MESKIEMPIRAAPYKHQLEAFEFACRLFGLLENGEDDNDNSRRKGGDDYEHIQK